jgi:F-box protein 9
MLAKRHGLDWRSTFIEEPRVRYDGVYISVCHYVSVLLGAAQ